MKVWPKEWYSKCKLKSEQHIIQYQRESKRDMEFFSFIMYFASMVLILSFQWTKLPWPCTTARSYRESTKNTIRDGIRVCRGSGGTGWERGWFPGRLHQDYFTDFQWITYMVGKIYACSFPFILFCWDIYRSKATIEQERLLGHRSYFVSHTLTIIKIYYKWQMPSMFVHTC